MFVNPDAGMEDTGLGIVCDSGGDCMEAGLFIVLYARIRSWRCRSGSRMLGPVAVHME